MKQIKYNIHNISTHKYNSVFVCDMNTLTTSGYKWNGILFDFIQ